MSDHLPRQRVDDGLKNDPYNPVVQLVFLFPDMDLVAPLLGDVEGSVCEANELVGVRPMFGERSDTDAQVERELLFPPQVDDPCSYSFSRIDDALSIVDEENHDEFVSPPA
jgi:hypothetical protein